MPNGRPRNGCLNDHRRLRVRASIRARLISVCMTCMDLMLRNAFLHGMVLRVFVLWVVLLHDIGRNKTPLLDVARLRARVHKIRWRN